MVNARGRPWAAALCHAVAPVLAAAGGAALMGAVWLPDLDPTAHVYPATMWVLVLWTVVHIGLGILMNLFCLFGLLVGDFTPRRDAPLWNVSLFWHFLGLTMLVTVCAVAVLPRLL